MKKRLLPLLLAVLMVCSLLPFSALAAADLSPYAAVILEKATANDHGILYDLNGDGTLELVMVIEQDRQYHGQVYTIKEGNAQLLLDEIVDDGIAAHGGFALVADGKGAVIAFERNVLLPAGSRSGREVVKQNGFLKFYKLDGGAMRNYDTFEYQLLVYKDTLNDQEYKYVENESTITRNGSSVGGDVKYKVVKETKAKIITALVAGGGDYPMQQVYNALQGFFQDVALNQYYAVPVAWANAMGITNGTGPNAFSPNAVCTRGQVVTFLWRNAGMPKTDGSNPFADVKNSDFFYDAVLWAVDQEVTTGTSATTFSPSSTCTRGQIVTFLYRALAE